MSPVRHLELALLVVALPVFLLADLPLLGYATGAGAWLVQKAIGLYLLHRAERAQSPRNFVGLMAGSMIARGWLVALAIFGVGLAAGDRVGLSAAVLFLALLTVSFTIQMVMRPFDGDARATR
jgi:hypothetical protein